jgi:hypothetical protein
MEHSDVLSGMINFASDGSQHLTFTPDHHPGGGSAPQVRSTGDGVHALHGDRRGAVSAGVDSPREDVEPPPEFGSQVDVQFMEGMAKVGEKLVVVLDLERVSGTEELATPGPAT